MTKFSIGDKVQIDREALLPTGVSDLLDQVGVIRTINNDIKDFYKVEFDKNRVTWLFANQMIALAVPPATDAVEYPDPSYEASETKVLSTILADDIVPQRYIVSVQFPSDQATNRNRRYEYLAFGTYEELQNASHAVVTKVDHTDIDDLLLDEELVVVRILDVYPTSQQRFNGKLRWIVDFVDGSTFVNRNMKEQKAQQLRKDIKRRIEEITALQVLEEAVKKTNDPKALELYNQLKELGDE